MDAPEPTVEARDRRGASAETSRRHEIPEFTDLIFAARHQPLRVLVVGSILSLLLVWAAWVATSPRFRAEGLVRVRQEQDVIFAAQTSRSTDSAFFHSQEQLALSPQVLAKALDDEEVRGLGDLVPQEQPIEWLRGQMRVDMQSGSEVMTIAAIHDSPRVAYALANGVTQAYLAEITNRLTADRARREQELEQAAKHADQQLDTLWDELNSVAQEIGSDSSHSIAIRDELKLQSYRDYSRQLQTAQLRGNELQAQLVTAKERSTSAAASDRPVTDAMLADDPEVMAAKQRLRFAREQFDQVREVAADPSSPRLDRLARDLETYETELTQVIQRRREAIAQQMRTQSASASESSVAELVQQVARNRAEKEFLRERLSEIDTGIADAEDETGVPLEMWRHDIQRQTGLADQLWQSLQELRIEQQAQPRVTLIELADVPTRADHSRQLKISAAAGMSAWMLAILTVGFVEWRDCRIRYAADVSSRFVFPLFGKDIHDFHATAKRDRAAMGAREAAAQIMLIHPDSDRAPTITVASATSPEPRHLAATELARALCRFRRRTLLIDADAIGNRLSRSLGVERLPGLRQADGSVDARYLVIPTDDERLDYLSLGPSDDDDAWVDPSLLRQAIRSLRDDYQAIVVNGPPLLASAESLLVASQTDMLLMTAQVGNSRWDQLGIAAQSAAQAGISIGGCILQQRGRGKKLQLDIDRQGSPSIATTSDTDVSELHREIDEIKHDIHAAFDSDASATPLESSQASETENRESTS